MSRNYSSGDRYASSYNDHYNNSSYDNRRDSYGSRGAGNRGRGGYFNYRGGSNRHSGSYESRENSNGRHDDINTSSPARANSSSALSNHQQQEQQAFTPERADTESRSNSFNSSRGDFRNGGSTRDDYNSGSYRGGYRDSYRGGYRGRGGLQSPYARSNSYHNNSPNSSTPVSKIEDSRTGRSSSSPSVHVPYHELQQQQQQQQQQSPTASRAGPLSSRQFTAPWISILSLDRLKRPELDLLGPDGELELKRLRDDREILFKKSGETQKKLHESKVKNISLDFEIDTLKAQLARDELNAQLTQEKLDFISFL